MIPANHPAIPRPRVGLLLVNLGTPDAPDTAAVRRYLREFLSDRRVVELPALIWQPVLWGAILPRRPQRSAHAYAQVWGEGGSPLATVTRDQAAGLAERLVGDGVLVDYAMRYGNPRLPDRLQAMKDAGCERILVAPLYPQYCGATTATANDYAFLTLAGMRWQPALRTLPPYHDDPAYIEALAGSVREALAALDAVPDALVVSFHGMPRRTLDKGDPYHCHCQKTARLLGEALGREIVVTFQSRFGRAKWLEPATDEVLAALPGRGVKHIAIVAPGFSADCVETLEELSIRGRETFLEAGGERFDYIPCLNASPRGLDLLEHLARRELAGWLPRS